MSFSVDVLANIAIELAAWDWSSGSFSAPDHHAASGAGVRCVCVATLRLAAVYSACHRRLAKDVLGRRFALEGHPRLEAIARAGDVVRFPADSELPDPYDGLIPGQESLKVHCLRWFAVVCRAKT